MKFRDILKRIKLYKHSTWKLTDFFIEVKNMVTNQISPLSSLFNKDKDESEYISGQEYTCIRNFEGFSLYVPSNDLNKFLSLDNIYNKEFNLLNMSEVRRYKVSRKVLANVYDRISPPTVKVKIVEGVIIKNISAYLVYTMDLTYNDPLYNELLNYTKIEEKY